MTPQDRSPRPDHRRGRPPQARRHRQRDAVDAAAQLVLADRQGRARRLREPVHARRHNARAVLLDPDPSRDADPGGRARSSRPIRSTRMREGDIYILNDPYTGGTHLPDIAVDQPVFHRGQVDRAQRRHDASPGRRRHVGGLGADQRHRDLPGGPAHPAAEAARGRCLQRHAGRDAAPERAHPRHGDGRPQRPGRRVHDRRRAGSPSSPSATATTSWPRSSTSCCRARRR